MIYLTHPDHGTHIAYSQQEVETCQANGWTVREPDPAPSFMVLTPMREDITDLELHSLRLQYSDKFGKPAHHRKSVDTLRKELA